MDKRGSTVEVAVEELKDSRPAADGAGVVLDTTAQVDGVRHDTQIEVPHDEAPAVAVALMNTPADGDSAAGDPDSDPLPPALLCLAAGVIEGVESAGVRLHLQFDSGQVLPLEMSIDAAAALVRGLSQHLQRIRPAGV